MCRSKLAKAKKGVKMNIHNQQPTVTNFKGIQQEIMSDFGKHGRKYSESIANPTKAVPLPMHIMVYKKAMIVHLYSVHSSDIFNGVPSFLY